MWAGAINGHYCEHVRDAYVKYPPRPQKSMSQLAKLVGWGVLAHVSICGSNIIIALRNTNWKRPLQ